MYVGQNVSMKADIPGKKRESLLVEGLSFEKIFAEAFTLLLTRLILA